MTNFQTEFDTPWKEVIEIYFEEFILFFFPQAHQEIDWTRTPEFLDKELQQVVRDAELGRRLVDKLVKVYRTCGEEAWVLVHIEVQSQEESNFSERMFVYHYRIYDRYRRSVASLAVLGDESGSWRPNQFEDRLFGSEILFRFPIVKLLDYRQQESTLQASRNPFATVVMAHLKAQETRKDGSKRKASKLALTRRLYEQQFERQDILNLFRFIDWVMNLPKALEQEFDQELSQYEESRRMPYITSIERMGMEKGREEGIKEGILEGISLVLEVKFGSEALNLIPEISQIQDVEQLREIMAALKTVTTLEQLRQIYQK